MDTGIDRGTEGQARGQGWIGTDIETCRKTDRGTGIGRKKVMDRDRPKKRDRYRHTGKKMRCCVKSQVIGPSYCPLTGDPGQ